MSQAQIANVVRHFGISPEWIPAYDALVNEGRVISLGFGRLIRSGRFGDALDMMKELLSAEFIQHFGNDVAQLERARAIAR